MVLQTSSNPANPLIQVEQTATAQAATPLIAGKSYQGKQFLSEKQPNMSVMSAMTQHIQKHASSMYTALHSATPSWQSFAVHITPSVIERTTKGPIITALTLASCHPIDNYLTKIQTGNPKKTAFEQVCKKPYKGVSLKVSQNLLMTNSLFIIKPSIDGALSQVIPENPRSVEFLSGITCGCFQAVVTAPFSSIYTKLMVQNQNTQVNTPNSSETAASSPTRQPKTIDIYRSIPKGEKIQALWSGAPASALRNAGFLGFYFPTKSIALEGIQALNKAVFSEASEMSNYPMLEHAIAGLIAGSTASLASLPLDIVAKGQRASKTPITMRQSCSAIYSKAGVPGLFRGAPAVAVRMGSAGIAYAVGEYVTKEFAQAISSQLQSCGAEQK